MPSLPPIVASLWQGHGLKLLRLCGVSVFNLVFGQSLLFFFHSVMDWPGWIANVLSVVISAVPAYLLSRHWVWQKRGRNSFRTEVLPFWSMALLGLLISTAAVAFVDGRFDGALPVQLASVGSFGFVWVIKFFLLDRVIWKDHGHAPASPAVATGA